ncbi:MAG: hypothetical protein RR287_01000 [Oscillospiraceae bacterium]
MVKYLSIALGAGKIATPCHSASKLGFMSAIRKQNKINEVIMTLTNAAAAKMPTIKKMYEDAFPFEERKPFWMIRRLCKKGSVEILTNFGDEVDFFAVSAICGDMVLIDYFAVNDSLRGRGVGSCAIAAFADRYRGKRLFLEIEAPEPLGDEYEIKRRRKDFYLRNGFESADIFAMVFGVKMELLTYGCRISYDEYRKLYRNVFGLIPYMNIKSC